MEGFILHFLVGSLWCWGYAVLKKLHFLALPGDQPVSVGYVAAQKIFGKVRLSLPFVAGSWKLFVVPAAGGELRLLGDGLVDGLPGDEDMLFSPDSRRLLFVSDPVGARHEESAYGGYQSSMPLFSVVFRSRADRAHRAPRRHGLYFLDGARRRLSAARLLRSHRGYRTLCPVFVVARGIRCRSRVGPPLK